MKLKRELGAIDPSEVLVEGPRTKRRKRGSSALSLSVNEDVDMANGDSSSIAGADTKPENESVKELGLKIWNAVRNAKGKDDRILSVDFMRLPSKRQYADYYNLIKRPISLDEIKAQLDSKAYPSIDAVKQDFDTCFKNAKRYNMRESQIWKDAKTLHKLVVAEYNTVTGVEEDVDVIGSEDEGGGSDDEGKGRSPRGKPGRPPSLNRLLKTRMQKLVDKTDDTGRLMTEDFMELPSKKIYPIYYKTIKKLMCFDMIFKKIRRKEYASAAEFAADVELVFSNALTFNEEHSPIWEDAASLKEYFRNLMSDLPASHALSQYSGTAQHAQNGKLKLRVPAPGNAHSKGAPTQNGGAPLTVKLPAPANAATVTQHQAASRHVPPAVKQGSASKSPNLSTRLPQTSHAQNTAQTSSSYLHPATFSQGHPHQPQPQYHQHSQATSQTQSATHSISPSPLPPTPTPPIVTFDHPLRSFTLKTMPLGRTLRLDSSEGVRTWVLRLGKSETALDVSEVMFSENEESDEDEDEDESKSGTTNGKGDVIVKVNGKLVNARVPNEKEGEGIWQVSELKSGPNVLEVGERDGEIWKVVLHRIGITA